MHRHRVSISYFAIAIVNFSARASIAHQSHSSSSSFSAYLFPVCFFFLLVLLYLRFRSHSITPHQFNYGLLALGLLYLFVRLIAGRFASHKPTTPTSIDIKRNDVKRVKKEASWRTQPTSSQSSQSDKKMPLNQPEADTQPDRRESIFAPQNTLYHNFFVRAVAR